MTAATPHAGNDHDDRDDHSRRQAWRLAQRERALSAPGPSGAAVRWLLGGLGAFFVNSPLYRLPENLMLQPSMRVLDVGCGRGALLRLLHERVRFRHAPVGIDCSATALRLADGDERRVGRPSRLARATATALPFRDAAFDLVLCGYVAGRLDDDDLLALCLELRRVTAERGLVLLWEFAPTGDPRLDAWNRRVLSRGATTPPRLRSSQALLQVAQLVGFEFRREARLRPFLLPPIPRASILVGVPPAEPAAGAQPPLAEPAPASSRSSR